jgi:hypothetical protein
MVMVADDPFTDWLRVIELPPARNKATLLPDTTPDVPDVFPRLEIPSVFDPAAPPAPVAEMTTDPFVAPMLTFPAPTSVNDLASRVVDDAAPVVCDDP